MKTKILLLLTFLIIAISCSKNSSESVAPISSNGNYIGTFERNGIISSVQLNLNNGTFNGQSATQKFPALCSGTYIISGNIITFESTCAWTADFDWTLILNEAWNFTLNGNTLIMLKANGDKYTLTRQ